MTTLSKTQLIDFTTTARAAYNAVTSSLGDEVRQEGLRRTMYRVWCIWDTLSSSTPRKGAESWLTLAQNACESAMDAYQARIGSDWVAFARKG